MEKPSLTQPKYSSQDIDTNEYKLSKWNWGAFYFGWIWCVSMRFYLGILLSLTGIGSIILGIYGNQWAWKCRQFKSIEEFTTVQKAWTKWAAVCLVVSLGIFLLLCFGVFSNSGLSISTIDDATNEQTIRPAHIGLLTKEESATVKKLDIKRIVPNILENKPYDFSLNYASSSASTQSVSIFENMYSTEGKNPYNPDISVTISQWLGYDDKFLLPKNTNISMSDLREFVLQDDTIAYTFWQENKLLNTYSYYVFWIKRPFKFLIKTSKSPSLNDFDIANIDHDIIEKKALEMVNRVATNSSYLFENKKE